MQAGKNESDWAKRFVYYFAAVYTLLCFAFFFCLFAVPIPAANKDIMNIITGSLIVGGSVAINKFFFGSTRSNEDKNEVIHNLSNQLTSKQ